MDRILNIAEQNYILIDSITYPNGGQSGFYVNDHDVIILDDGICN